MNEDTLITKVNSFKGNIKPLSGEVVDLIAHTANQGLDRMWSIADLAGDFRYIVLTGACVSILGAIYDKLLLSKSESARTMALTTCAKVCRQLDVNPAEIVKLWEITK